MSLRLEKSFGTWAREFRPIYGPLEAGLDRFVDLEKNDFIGRDAALREKASGGAQARLTPSPSMPTDADAIGDEPIWHGGKVVGWVTSGGYGHSVGKSIALGYVENAVAGETARLCGRVDGREAGSGAQRGCSLRSCGATHAGVMLDARG